MARQKKKNNLVFISVNYLCANENLSSNLFINNSVRNEIIIVIDSQIHIDYGLSYPITYELSIPSNSFDLVTFVKFKYRTKLVTNTRKDNQ